jgi:hypothetical protein
VFYGYYRRDKENCPVTGRAFFVRFGSMITGQSTGLIRHGLGQVASRRKTSKQALDGTFTVFTNG